VIQGEHLALALLCCLVFRHPHGAGDPRCRGVARDEPALHRGAITSAQLRPRQPRSVLRGDRHHGQFRWLSSCFPDFFAPLRPAGAFALTPSSPAPQPGSSAVGTDNFGRDVLSRVIWATLIDMQIGQTATIAPLRSSHHRWGGRGVSPSITALARRARLRTSESPLSHFPVLGELIAIVAGRGPGLINHYRSPSTPSAGLCLCPSSCAPTYSAKRTRLGRPLARVLGL